MYKMTSPTRRLMAPQPQGTSDEPPRWARLLLGWQVWHGKPPRMWLADLAHALFWAAALHSTFWLPFGLAATHMAERGFHGALTLLAALLVLWGLWKGHMVLGSLMLAFGGTFLGTAHLYTAGPHGLAILWETLWSSLLGMALLACLVVWTWVKRLAPVIRPPVRTSGPPVVRSLLLVGNAACLLASMVLQGLAMAVLRPAAGPAPEAGSWFQALGRGLDQQLPVPFHAAFFAVLAGALLVSLWRGRSDVATAACCLFGPALALNLWPPTHPVLISGSLLLLGLGGLTLWYHRFAGTLWQNRRAPLPDTAV